jgi:small-conductance mechanosensitive channel
MRQFILALLVLLLSLGSVGAQTTTPGSTVTVGEEGAAVPSDLFSFATVVVDGEELFTVFGLRVLPANQRARNIVRNIVTAAEQSDSLSVDMEVRKEEFGYAIYADGVRITIVTDTDASFGQVAPDLLAKLQSDAIMKAISSYREGRSDRGLLFSFLKLIFFTFIFGGASYLMFRYRGKAADWVENRVANRLSGVEEATSDIVSGDAIASFAKLTVRLSSIVIFLTMLYYYLSVALYAFAGTRSVATTLLRFLTEPIAHVVEAVIAEIPNVIILVVIWAVTRYLIKITRLIFISVDQGRIKFDGFERQWVWPTFNIIRALLILFAFVFAFPYIPGSDSDAFKGASIVLGVMMSLGSSSVIGNLLAGLFIIYKRSTNIGDRIRVGQHVGDVVAIKLTETHLKSIKNELISIPNAELLNSQVINYSSPIDGRGLIIHTTVGIGYEEPQEKIEALLIEAAKRTSALKKSPPPFVYRTALADYAVNYEINGFTARGESRQRILSELHSNILDTFNEAGVQIMTPSYMADPAEPKVAPVGWKPDAEVIEAEIAPEPKPEPKPTRGKRKKAEV